MKTFLLIGPPFIWAVSVSVVSQCHFHSTYRLLSTYYVTFFEVGDESCNLRNWGRSVSTNKSHMVNCLI